MSGFTALKPFPRSCCAAREWFRQRRIDGEKEEWSPHFTCLTCGQAYEWTDAGGWNPVGPLKDLKAMVAADSRGHLSTEGKS